MATKRKLPKRLKNGTLVFDDHPEFRPNLTPKEMFQAGVFGGTYYRPIHSSITKLNYKDQWKEFPKSWFTGLDIEKMVASPNCNKSLNKYGVTSGTSLRYWETQGWIKAQDPYGWVQWYCRFYLGRRTDDDERQIARFNNIAGPNGRFRLRLENMLAENAKKVNKKPKNEISPVIHQLLIQWGCEV